MFIVIGGTSGIGLETARLLVNNGYDTLVCGRSRPKEDIKFKSLDVSDEEMIKEFFSNYESIDGIVYSAGITISKQGIESFDTQAFQKLLDTNLTGFLLCMKYAYKALKKAKGKVVVVNSVAARVSSALSGLEYTISKAALSGAVKQLAIDWAKDAILVNSVFPSMTATPMLAKNVSAKQIKTIEKKIPLQRIAQAREIANAIEFLLSKNNTYMTGSGIDINGGLYLSS